MFIVGGRILRHRDVRHDGSRLGGGGRRVLALHEELLRAARAAAAAQVQEAARAHQQDFWYSRVLQALARAR